MYPPWTAPDDLWDDDESYQVFYNTVTGNQITEHPLVHEQHKKERQKAKAKAKAAAGRVPVLDLLRIWDTGASQGMVDKAVVSSKNAFVGDEISVCTGNGTVSSRRYERCEIAPVCLRYTLRCPTPQIPYRWAP